MVLLEVEFVGEDFGDISKSVCRQARCVHWVWCGIRCFESKKLLVSLQSFFFLGKSLNVLFNSDYCIGFHSHRGGNRYYENFIMLHVEADILVMLDAFRLLVNEFIFYQFMLKEHINMLLRFNFR